jgi:hypothetical protein
MHSFLVVFCFGLAIPVQAAQRNLVVQGEQEPQCVALVIGNR